MWLRQSLHRPGNAVGRILLPTILVAATAAYPHGGGFDEAVFANDDDAASLAVSDHRPIWVTLFTELPDDDGPSVSTGMISKRWGKDVRVYDGEGADASAGRHLVDHADRIVETLMP